MIENQEIAFATRSELLSEYFCGVFLFFIIFLAFAGVLIDKFYSDKEWSIRRKIIFLAKSGFLGIIFWFVYSYNDYFSSFYAMQCGRQGEESFVRLKFLFQEKSLLSEQVYSRRGMSGYRGGHTWTYRIFRGDEYGYKSISLTLNEFNIIHSMGKSCGFVEQR